MLVLKIFFSIFITSFIYNATAIANDFCQSKNHLEVFSNTLFEKLSIPNCTEEFPEPNFTCECATKDLEPFYKNNKELFKDFEKVNINKDYNDRISRMAQAKVVTLLYDLFYAKNTFEVSPHEIANLTNTCSLKKLQDQLDSCKKDSYLLKGDEGKAFLENFFISIKNEGKILSSDKFENVNTGFFHRKIAEANKCQISDKHIFEIRNYLDIYELLDKKSAIDDKEQSFSNSTLGYYLQKSGKQVNIEAINNFQDLQHLAKNNKNNFLESFQKDCSKSFQEIETVFCAESEPPLPTFQDFSQKHELETQFYEDKGFKSEKYLRDLDLTRKYCESVKAQENNNKNLNSAHGNNLEDILINGVPSSSMATTQKDGIENKKIIRKGSLYNLGLAKVQDSFQKETYRTEFQDYRENICKVSPLTKDKLTNMGCDLKDFSKNLKYKNNTSDTNGARCDLLVIEYILSLDESQLATESENIDPTLISYRKTIEENKKSNGGDLILDFLGVETPQEVASFKEAGIERSSASSSSDETSTKKNNVNTNATAQTKNPATYQQVNQAFAGQGASSGNQNINGQTNYQSAEAYHSMTAQEQNQVSEVERELMRRLMGSKVSESSSAAKAEMYQKYSKEMMELAKEKARLEASGTSASDQDLASYEKKMQDLVNQMREDNKKIANAQKGNSNDNSGTTYINNFQGSSKGSNEGSSATFGGSGESISSGGVSNSNLNRALNETVNADKYAELTGKKPNQEASGASRSIASDETGIGLALIENNKLVAITSLEEVFSKKIKEKKPFVIAQKDNPNFKVRITPDRDNKVTITPLGNLSDPSYKKFFEEIEESFKTDKELQKYHRKDLVESFSAIQR